MTAQPSGSVDAKSRRTVETRCGERAVVHDAAVVGIETRVLAPRAAASELSGTRQ